MVFGWRKAFCTSFPSNQDKSHQSSSDLLHTDPPIPTPRLRSKFGFSQTHQLPASDLAAEVVEVDVAPPLQPQPLLHLFPLVPDSNAGLQAMLLRGQVTPRLLSFSLTLLLPNHLLLPPTPASLSSVLHFSSTRVTVTDVGYVYREFTPTKSTRRRFSRRSVHIRFTSLAPLDYKTSAALSAPPRGVTLRGKILRLRISDPTRLENPDPRNQNREVAESLQRRRAVSLLARLSRSVQHYIRIRRKRRRRGRRRVPRILPGFFDHPGGFDLREPRGPIAAGIRRGGDREKIETHVAVMKVKASPMKDAVRARRPSIDLVAVLDLSGGGANLQTVKHAMRLVISLLREMDRLSIVVFSTGSKRLMPLRRMTARGRGSARRIVDSLGGVEATGGGGMSVSDALKKAVKVVEDRRERNQRRAFWFYQTRVPFVVSTTRLSRPMIPVHSVWIASPSALQYAPLRDAFTERVAALFNVALHDVKLNLCLVSGSPLTEISAVYSLTGRPESFGSGSAVVVGDLFAEEEREFLVELKVPTSSSGSHRVMSVRSSVVDPATLQPFPCPNEKRFLIPRPQTVRFVSASIERLRNRHSVCRAVAESRKMIEREDLAGAYEVLTAARSNALDENDSLKSLDAELAELNRLKPRDGTANRAEEEKTEQLTPTSAWRAAEKLAKVAIMRKHLNRVSDMHGLENARF
ncbi:hypothetical protein Bca52824_055818 [Brassica carinata]|uniref:VWFA domain-containing protein n=1 Tax=Brassica carinata TaxID=52824 RepID=A0A8X7RD71_BRACI|nr:hypothetical protein Bca52824_055818 [Brassica carinata]